MARHLLRVVMKNKTLILFPLLAILFFTPVPGMASDSEFIDLPDPRLEAGQPLMAALKARKSIRSFSTRLLSNQTLSELLWAAFGINRPESKKRTAPSAHDRQEVDIYIAMAKGLYRYNAAKHALQLVSTKDIRHLTGRQKFPGDAPVNLVYVVDFSRMTGVPRQAAIEVAAVSTGAMVQNVYLYCASEGLGAVARGWIDRDALGDAMNLREDQYIILAQTVGYPNE